MSFTNIIDISAAMFVSLIIHVIFYQAISAGLQSHMYGENLFVEVKTSI
jgi:hypothetical protein